MGESMKSMQVELQARISRLRHERSLLGATRTLQLQGLGLQPKLPGHLQHKLDADVLSHRGWKNTRILEGTDLRPLAAGPQYLSVLQLLAYRCCDCSLSLIVLSLCHDSLVNKFLQRPTCARRHCVYYMMFERFYRRSFFIFQ